MDTYEKCYRIAEEKDKEKTDAILEQNLIGMPRFLTDRENGNFEDPDLSE